jgi:hypothetical protein
MSDSENQGLVEDFEFNSVDPILLIINRWANMQSSIEIGVILHINGVMVSGSTISAKQWMKLQAESFRTVENEEMKPVIDVMAGYFSDLADGVYSGNDNGDSKYIHLKNAFTLTPNGKRMSSAVTMRIKIADINGFSFGSIS